MLHRDRWFSSDQFFLLIQYLIAQLNSVDYQSKYSNWDWMNVLMMKPMVEFDHYLSIHHQNEDQEHLLHELIEIFLLLVLLISGDFFENSIRNFFVEKYKFDDLLEFFQWIFRKMIKEKM